MRPTKVDGVNPQFAIIDVGESPLTPQQIHWLTQRWADDWEGSRTTEEIRGLISAAVGANDAVSKLSKQAKLFNYLIVANRAIKRWRTA